MIQSHGSPFIIAEIREMSWCQLHKRQQNWHYDNSRFSVINLFCKGVSNTKLSKVWCEPEKDQIKQQTDHAIWCFKTHKLLLPWEKIGICIKGNDYCTCWYDWIQHSPCCYHWNLNDKGIFLILFWIFIVFSVKTIFLMMLIWHRCDSTS